MSDNKNKTGAQLIADERRRHKSLGWGPAQDDRLANGELAQAAAYHAAPQANCNQPDQGNDCPDYPKAMGQPGEPKNRLEELIWVGALAAAEIDRMLRAGHKLDTEPVVETEQDLTAAPVVD
jgi:hypothetical protein